MRRPLALGAAGVTSLVLLAGCGSSSSSSSSGASAPASTPTQSTAASTTAASGSAMTIATAHGKLGTILVAGPDRRTVYLFEADKGSSSTCSGDCAQDWPPVTTQGKATAAGSAVSADLGTTMRSDGSEQVTYKGHPLYFFDDDKKAGEAKGQGSEAFGAGWYVMTANGNKVDDDDDSGDKGSDDDS